MFQAPRKNTVAARRYKGVINAKRGRNDTSYREEHQDSHYLFARVAYRLELAAMFADETAVFSCDDMNKLKVGAAAVSRYHQLSRYFEVGDSPNLPDHDFPVPGYLLIPSGYMMLEGKGGNPTQVQTNAGQPVTDSDDIVFADFSEYDLRAENNCKSICESQETCQPDANNNKQSNSEYKLDKLNRPHIKTEHTGSALVVVRAQRFHSSTVETHVNDIYPLLKSLKEQGKSAVVLTVDGGLTGTFHIWQTPYSFIGCAVN